MNVAVLLLLFLFVFYRKFTPDMEQCVLDVPSSQTPYVEGVAMKHGVAADRQPRGQGRSWMSVSLVCRA